MSDTAAGIAGIQARVASIQSRFVPARDDVASSNASIPDPVVTDFEPFGDAYQRAVADLRASGEVRPSSGATGASLSATSAPTGISASTASSASTMIGAGLAERTVAPTLPVGTRWTSDGIRILPPSTGTFAGVGAVGSGTWGGVGAGTAVGKIGGFGKMPVPPELEVHGNGRIPTGALAEIGQGSHRLHGPAAESWRALVAHAAADGIELRITDSYRSYEHQVDLAARKGLYRDGGLAAVPGTSNHGWGLAVDADVTDPATLAWIRENGPRFGWVEAVPREPWHWEYRPHQT